MLMLAVIILSVMVRESQHHPLSVLSRLAHTVNLRCVAEHMQMAERMQMACVAQTSASAH